MVDKTQGCTAHTCQLTAWGIPNSSILCTSSLEKPLTCTLCEKGLSQKHHISATHVGTAGISCLIGEVRDNSLFLSYTVHPSLAEMISRLRVWQLLSYTFQWSPVPLAGWNLRGEKEHVGHRINWCQHRETSLLSTSCLNPTPTFLCWVFDS